MNQLIKTALPAALLAALPLTADAGLILGWETWASGSEAASTAVGDITGLGVESGDWRESNRAASNDGTFGTAAGASTATGAASTGTYIGQTGGSGSYAFTITAGVDQVILETFHFDARRKRNNSPENWSVDVVAGDISLVNLGSGSLGNTLGTIGPSDHDDFDLDMTGLADNVLDPGQSATVRISWSGGNPTNSDQRTYMDNVGFSGQVVPEPASLALLSLGGLMIARRRRSMR
ncbi:MAG: PEP-CTERM sorting domain-containing protein [Phycisphaeraceae bacterium]